MVAFSRDGTTIASISRDYTVELWDTATRQRRQTLNVDKILSSISFDLRGSCIRTDIGSISLEPPSSLSKIQATSIPFQPSQQPYYRGGYGVSSDST